MGQQERQGTGVTGKADFIKTCLAQIFVNQQDQ